MPRPMLYLTLGFPGSGKTYFSRRFAKENNLIHLNSDKLRLEMFDQPTYRPAEHKLVFRAMDYITEELLSKGISVIYDTNMNKRVHRQQKRAMAAKYHADTTLLWFKVPLGVAVGRVTNRSDGEDKYFPNFQPEVVHKLKRELQEPTDEPYVEVDGTAPYREQIKRLEH